MSAWPGPSIAPGVRVTRRTTTFLCVVLPTRPGEPPIEVSLVSHLSHGLGTQPFHDMLKRQRQNSRFVDELDEPSAKLSGTDFSKGDPTALYSFRVGKGGHPVIDRSSSPSPGSIHDDRLP